MLKKTLAIAMMCMMLPLVYGRMKEAAAVGVNVEPGGKVTYFIFGTGAVGPLENLPGALRRSGYEAVDISAWSSRIDYQGLLDDLRGAGLTVTSCYVPARGKAAWFRKDLAKATHRMTEQAPPVYLKRLIDDNAYNREHKLPGKFKQVHYVTIHNTAEPFSAIQERDRVDFRRDRQKVSFHYAVDERQIVQILPLDIHGWHAADGRYGKGNRESIAIEICRSQCRDDQAFLYERSEANAKILACALLRHYGLSAQKLRMHQDWCGKFCPHRILERGPKAFERFRQEVDCLLKSKPGEAERSILKELKRQRRK